MLFRYFVISVLQICVIEKVNYIVSPYEADAQMAFLVSKGYGDFVLTEYSDRLAYGCKKVSFR